MYQDDLRMMASVAWITNLMVPWEMCHDGNFAGCSIFSWYPLFDTHVSIFRYERQFSDRWIKILHEIKIIKRRKTNIEYIFNVKVLLKDFTIIVWEKHILPYFCYF